MDAGDCDYDGATSSDHSEYSDEEGSECELVEPWEHELRMQWALGLGKPYAFEPVSMRVSISKYCE